MKKPVLCLTLLSASLSPLAAQVRVEVALDQDQFLPGEALPVAVRVTNRSGQTLRLGAEEDWLTFSVESRDGLVVAKTGDVPVTGEFVLDSSKVATKRVDLAPYFSLSEPGRYEIVATVRIKDWNHEVASPPKGFDIIQGARLWEQDFGLPKTSGASNAIPEVRKYILQRASYLKAQLRLYLRVTDAAGTRAFRVFPIGPMVSFSRPEPQVDRMSNLHVLYQDGPHSFSYAVFNPDGNLTTRQTYEYVNSRPRLAVDEDGKFYVLGGLRRPAANDMPPAAPASAPAAATNNVEKGAQ